MDVGAGNGRGGGNPEGRRGDVAGNGELAGVQGLATLDFDGVAFDRDRGAKSAQRQLGVIACCRGLHNSGRAVGLEAGQKHRALDLRAGHFSGVANAFESPAVDGQRRLAGVRFDARAHELERRDDTRHRPAGERRVPFQHGRERMRSQHARQQPHRRARVLRVERPCCRPEPAESASIDLDRQAIVGGTRPANACPCHFEAVERRRAVGALRILIDSGSPGRQGGEKGITVRNGFITGEPDRPGDAAGRPHRRSGD